MEKLDKLIRKEEKKIEGEFWSIDELSHEIKKSRSTVKNVLNFEPKIQRKMDGKKMNLVHKNDFIEAYERYKKQDNCLKFSTGKIQTKKVG